MLQILAISIADKDHLLQESAIRMGLGANLPEDQQKLLDRMVLEAKSGK